jgi:hypothetical protein
VSGDIVERVAEAMWKRTHDGRWEEWGDGQDESREIYLLDARAGIEEMRTPTQEMLAAANRLNHPRDFDVWQTMIDEALKPEIHLGFDPPK